MPSPSAVASDRSHSGVSVVLATLNERGNLPEVLDRIFRLPLDGLDVIVVDDGSTDGTREYVDERATREPRLRLVRHDGKQTTLRAQCQGIDVSRGSRIIVMDADLQHPPEAIPDMLARLAGGASLVVASRYASGGSPGPRTPYRLALSRGAEWIARQAIPEARGVSDPVSGFFGFRREIFVPMNPLYRGYKLLLFVLVMSGGREVSEVGYRFEPRVHGASKATEGFRFIRLFLIEVLLARRLRKSLAGGDPLRETPIASRT